MNTHSAFRSYFEGIAGKLLLLGREPGKINLFFGEGPETASTLLQAQKNEITLPCLMVEFEDEDKENGDAPFQVMKSAFVVLDKVDRQTVGVKDIEACIYERCKPAADQVFAKMKMMSDRMQLRVGGKNITLTGGNSGAWVGPLITDYYGWRIDFNWRFAGGSCYDPASWQD